MRRIVATYQVDDPNNRGSLYAGRLQYRPSGDGGLLVGATLLTEDQGIQDFTLYGFDLLLPLGDEGQIVGNSPAPPTVPARCLTGEMPTDWKLPGLPSVG